MTTEIGVPRFKVETSLFAMLKDGSKKFDMRKYEVADPRIERLTRSHVRPNPKKPDKPDLTYDEPLVEFMDKGSGEVVSFAYRGMEFVSWASGWCFLIIGEAVLPEASSVAQAAFPMGETQEVHCSHHQGAAVETEGLRCPKCGCVYWGKDGGTSPWDLKERHLDCKG